MTLYKIKFENLNLIFCFIPFMQSNDPTATLNLIRAYVILSYFILSYLVTALHSGLYAYHLI